MTYALDRMDTMERVTSPQSALLKEVILLERVLLGLEYAALVTQKFCKQEMFHFEGNFDFLQWSFLHVDQRLLQM